MSQEQWSKLMLGMRLMPVAVVFKLESVVKQIIGYKYFIPTHQGRAAEHVCLTPFSYT